MKLYPITFFILNTISFTAIQVIHVVSGDSSKSNESLIQFYERVTRLRSDVVVTFANYRVRVQTLTTFNDINYLVTNLSASYNDSVAFCSSLNATLILPFDIVTLRWITVKVTRNTFWTHVPKLSTFSSEPYAIVVYYFRVKKLAKPDCVLIAGLNDPATLKYVNVNCSQRHLVLCERLSRNTLGMRPRLVPATQSPHASILGTKRISIVAKVALL